jgi:hypothetical protein
MSLLQDKKRAEQIGKISLYSWFVSCVANTIMEVCIFVIDFFFFTIITCLLVVISYEISDEFCNIVCSILEAIPTNYSFAIHEKHR